MSAESQRRGTPHSSPKRTTNNPLVPKATIKRWEQEDQQDATRLRQPAVALIPAAEDSWFGQTFAVVPQRTAHGIDNEASSPLAGACSPLGAAESETRSQRIVLPGRKQAVAAQARATHHLASPTLRLAEGIKTKEVRDTRPTPRMLDLGSAPPSIPPPPPPPLPPPPPQLLPKSPPTTTSPIAQQLLLSRDDDGHEDTPRKPLEQTSIRRSESCPCSCLALLSALVLLATLSCMLTLPPHVTLYRNATTVPVAIAAHLMLSAEDRAQLTHGAEAVASAESMTSARTTAAEGNVSTRESDVGGEVHKIATSLAVTTKPSLSHEPFGTQGKDPPPPPPILPSAPMPASPKPFLPTPLTPPPPNAPPPPPNAPPPLPSLPPSSLPPPLPLPSPYLPPAQDQSLQTIQAAPARLRLPSTPHPPPPPFLFFGHPTSYFTRERMLSMSAVLLVATYAFIGLVVVGTRGETRSAAAALNRRLGTPASSQLRSRWKMMSRSQWAKEGDEVAPKSQWEQKSSPGRARPWSKELV